MNAPANPRTFRMMFDSMVNLVSGLGTARDKNIFAQYTITPLGQQQLEAAYRGDWVARKAVDIPAHDSTREWREWQASDNQIEKIEAEEKRLGYRHKVMEALIKSRLYGGAAIVLGVGESGGGVLGNASSPLITESIGLGGLKFMHVLSRHEIRAGQLQNNILDEFYGQPIDYEVSAHGEIPVKIHPSRIIRFIGNPLPDVRTAGADGWGDPILQAVDDAVKNVGLASQAIAALLNEAKTDVIKIPNLMQQISTTEYTDRLIERFSLINTAQSIVNTKILDLEEEWDRTTTDFSSLPDLLKLYVLIACGAVDIPSTRFLGQSAQGLNASGEGDLRNYYDHVKSQQENRLTPLLERSDDMLIRSALGTRDLKIHYEWRPLWQMDEVQKADVCLKKAQAFEIDVNAAIIDPDVLKKARENQLVEDAIYPGIEAAIEEFGTEGVQETEPNVQEQFAMLKAATGIQQLATGGGTKPGQPGAARPKPRLVRTGDASYTLVASEDFGGLVGDARHVLTDTEPRSLYVRRDVVNGAEIVAWARSQGFDSPLPADELHVTIAYSRAPVDWMVVGAGAEYGGGQNDKGQVVVPPGGPRVVEALGGGGAVVLHFSSSSLAWRHEDIKRNGASWDHDGFQPHVTISWDAADVDLSEVEPYRGRIIFGPEIFEEIEEDGWSERFRSDDEGFDESEHPRDPDGKWTSGGAGGAPGPYGPRRRLGAHVEKAAEWVRGGAARKAIKGLFTEEKLTKAATTGVLVMLGKMSGSSIDHLTREYVRSQVANLRDELSIGTGLAREKMKAVNLRLIEARKRQILKMRQIG